MSGVLFGAGIPFQFAVKRKIFVSYHHRGDQAYYDAFSRTFSDAYDVVTDNSLERAIDSEDVDYVMRRIRENHITGTSCTVVLVGADTWGRKYVDWEIKATLDKQHGVIGIQLPTLHPNPAGQVSVPNRLHENIQSGYALWTTWAYVSSGSNACASLIEQANARDKKLIVNHSDRRLRNA